MTLNSAYYDNMHFDQSRHLLASRNTNIEAMLTSRFAVKHSRHRIGLVFQLLGKKHLLNALRSRTLRLVSDIFQYLTSFRPFLRRRKILIVILIISQRRINILITLHASGIQTVIVIHMHQHSGL